MAIIYSVTISVDKAIAPEWVQWMLTEHIPKVMDTGCFVRFHLHKLLDPIVDEGATTYNVLYECPSMQMYQLYRNEFAQGLQAQTEARYKNRYQAFRTLMERLDS
jgi:hypothetical protein